ncbi:AAA family ATPase [Candidatus Micrarchaeota archaeon]|nr:AAA family ATPase [Candidatus Micrarchaeota archaeon]
MPVTVELKVQEALQNDIGRGILRLDSVSRKKLDVSSGDIVEVSGKKSTGAIVWQSYPEDEGLGVVRMDALLRQNSSTGIGEKVRVSKASGVSEAKKVILAPTKAIRFQPDFIDYTKREFLGRPVSKGDTLLMGVLGQPLFFRVTQVTPKGICQITESTQFSIREEPIKEGEAAAMVSYEDIGGLGDKVVKVREMIELPLRHPELFARVGIDPPKGVLLYGYPGTGKTLLAKAVANESEANFYAIQGPEIVCVAGDTPIQLASGDTTEIKAVFDEAAKEGKVLNNGFAEGIRISLPVLSSDSNLSVVPANATHVMRMKADKSYLVQTARGFEARVSENQPFSSVDGNALKWVRAKELRSGDRIALVRKLDVEGREHVFDFSKLDNSKTLVRVGEKEALMSQLSEQELAEADAFKFFDARNASRSAWVRLPRHNSPEFMEFLGCMLSEGSISRRGDEVAYANNDPALRSNFSSLVKSVFDSDIRVMESDNKVSISSKIVSGFLTRVCGLPNGRKPHDYHAPGFVKLAPTAWLARFVSAYFDGDGSASANNNFVTPAIFSKSRRMLEDLRFMLLRLGILAKISPHKTSYGPMLVLVLVGSKSRGEFAKLVSPKSSSKRAALLKTRDLKKTGDGLTLPKLPCLKELKLALRMRYGIHLPEGEFERYISQRDSITYRKLEALTHYFDKRLAQLKELSEMLSEIRLALASGNLRQAQSKLGRAFGMLDVKEGEVPHSTLMRIKYYLRDKARARSGKPLVEIADELKRILEASDLEKAESSLAFVKRILAGGVFFDEVTSVKLAGPLEVYDLSVDGHSNFVGGNMPAVLHNSKFVGEAEEKLRNIFAQAEENAPSIIFIDELDAIAPKREEVIGEVEKRIVAQLLSLMDGMKGRGKVIVIAATNRPNSIDQALRRPGRFDREIELGVPDRTGRREILKIHTRNMPLADDVAIEEFASITHGYVGADLAALAREAAMKALRRFLPKIDLEEETIPVEILEQIKVTRKDFYDGFKEVQPSAMREVLIENPNVHWSDIGGLEPVKKEIREAVEWPLKYPEMFKRMGIKPTRGILLFGPPGTGKTLLAKAVATESEANFISVRGPEIFNKFVGESEKAIREIFRKARQASPCIVFFDELDAIAPRRGGEFGTHVVEQVVNQLLVEMDGLEELKDVVVIGATNRPELLDAALLRPGRFDRLIQIPAPDKETRLEILKVQTKHMPVGKDVDLEKIAAVTDGYSGADLSGVVREAAMYALREDKQSKMVSWSHLERALKESAPSLEEKNLKRYEKFKKEYAGVEFV